MFTTRTFQARRLLFLLLSALTFSAFGSTEGVPTKRNEKESQHHQAACEINLYFVPNDVTLACSQLSMVNDPVVVDHTGDCCEPITLELEVDTIPGTCPTLFTLIRKWSAADQCGNSTSAQQMITVRDLTAPVFTQWPANVTVSCDSIPPPAQSGSGITVTDDCNGPVTLSFSETIIPGICAQQYLIIRTWVARDQCQNSSFRQQHIQVRDHKAPVFVNPPKDITIGCQAPPPPVPQVQAVDNCSAQVWYTFQESLTGGSYCNILVRTRVWTAEDMCGNRSTHTQTITQKDAGPPVFTNVPANITADCGEIPPNEPTVTDDCSSSPALVLTEQNIPGSCPGNFTLIRTWIATDDCGNSSTVSQTIQVSDTKPPVVTLIHPMLAGFASGDTMKVPCAATTIFEWDDASYEDACDPAPSIAFIDSLIFDDGCKKLIYCEWRATDFCGNSSSVILYMLIGDFTAPVLSGVPADLTIQCDQTPPSPAQSTSKDDCDLGPKITFNESIVPGKCPQEKVIVRTWTTFDFCGNKSTGTQTIRVVDTKAPVMTAVHPLLIGKPNGTVLYAECGQEPQFSDKSFQAVDNCDGSPTITITSSIEEADCIKQGFKRKITFVWTAVDDCGNQSTFTLFLIVEDTTPPVFTKLPAGLTISCDVPVPSTPPTASDACSPPASITFTDLQVPLACLYRIERTWTATDQCGNVASTVQWITVTDTKAPQLANIPADITLDCQLPLPQVPVISATDNCDPNPIVGFQEQTVPGNCPGSRTIERTWTATDHCGNFSSKTQYITLIDTVAPFFTVFPSDGTVQCDQVPQGTEGAEAEDNCAPQVTITVKETRAGGNCPDTYFLLREFTTDDGCGNTSKMVQKLVVVDEIPPVFETLMQDLTISCSQVNALPEPQVSDHCDPEPHIEASTITTTPGSCTGEYTLLVSWTATDRCGNSSTTFQKFYVRDIEAPVITPIHPAIAQVPNGTVVTAQCDNVPVMTAGDVNAMDSCDPNPHVEFIETAEIGDCLKDGYVVRLTCTWIATDDCGNESSYTIYVRVVDTKAPVLTNTPIDVTINVKNGETVPPPANVGVTDDCDKSPKISFTESSEPKECGYTLTRSWTAVDHCGNLATWNQELLVIEGCPCKKPTVKEIVSKHPKMGQANGSIEIDLIQDEADYQFIWLPNTGVPNPIGNARTQLTEGTYQIIVKDPLADASCFIKVNVILSMQWSCLDTIYLNIPQNDPYTTCIDNAIDLSGNIVSATVCGLDASAVSQVSFDLPTACLEIDPEDGFTGTTKLCVIHCDGGSPAACDTTILFITVNALAPCEEIFQDDSYQGETTECHLAAEVCLPVRPEILAGLSLTMNGEPYTKSLDGCDLTDMVGYDLQGLPGSGTAGPYGIEAWTFNGLSYSGFFDDASELAAWLNGTDTSGQWSYDPFSGMMLSTNLGGQYGDLIIRRLVDNSLTTLPSTIVELSQGTIIYALEGQHSFQSVHPITGCTDEVDLLVICTEEPDSLIAVDDIVLTAKNQANIINVLKNDMLGGGELDDLYISTLPSHGSVTLRPDYQVMYLPDADYCGQDSFSYVICNTSMCDTALVIIDVRCNNLVFHNGLSPNGDGVNDTFTISGVEAFPKNELVITNRWGNEVYRQKGYKNQWRGTWDNDLLPDGTYFYLFLDGEGQSYSGYLQINR